MVKNHYHYMAWAELFSAQPPGRLRPYMDFINSLDLSVRAYNCLAEAYPVPFSSAGDLLNATASKLRSMPNCGAQTIAEIRFVLEHQGYSHSITRQGWDRTCEARWRRINATSTASAPSRRQTASPD